MDPKEQDAAREKLTEWLRGHEENLLRFWRPVPLSDVARETGLTEDTVRALLSSGNPPYHVWPHTHAAKTSRSKPYCLRLIGPDAVGLDWEDSVVGAAEAELHRRGYRTNRELGTDQHVIDLLHDPDVSLLRPGINLRDLWAVRRDGIRLDVWIVEAKGKEAFEFAYYCLAETLAQLFPVAAEHLTALLGAKRGAGHGLCWKFAQALLAGWREQGLHPRITLAVLVPEWSPDVVWRGSKVALIPGSFYSAPLAALREFLEDGRSQAQIGRYKYQRAFGQALEDLDREVGLRRLSRAEDGIRFRVLAARSTAAGEFELDGL